MKGMSIPAYLIPHRGGRSYLFFLVVLNYPFKKKLFLIHTILTFGSIVVSVPACHAETGVRFPAGGQEIPFFLIVLSYLFEQKKYFSYTEL